MEQQFLEQDPSLGEFETMILQYETEIDTIADIPETIPVGAIALKSGNLIFTVYILEIEWNEMKTIMYKLIYYILLFGVSAA